MNISIQRMNYTMREMEMAQEVPGYQKRVAELPAHQRSHYWFIERKSKNGKTWIFVRDLMATKSEAAEIFCKWYRGKDVPHRLRHHLSY